ncbi:MAG: hypothetical protein JXQ81_09175 [Desulfuromonadales bacterium]|nr:hypothetical protein [Desulfuromonadales bacterium]MBN2792663.1 hypothetical protein [Desulfuromonadales bacterium]
MKFFIVVLFFVLVSSIPAFSKTCVKYDHAGNKIYYACPESPEKSYSLRWDVTTTKKGNEVIKKKIVLSTVCSQYGKGSVDYRRCRRQAQDYLEDKCNSLGQDARIDKDMCCEAARKLKFAR